MEAEPAADETPAEAEPPGQADAVAEATPEPEQPSEGTSEAATVEPKVTSSEGEAQ